MKPRMRPQEDIGGWCCYGYGFFGVGSTMCSAYRDWKHQERRYARENHYVACIMAAGFTVVGAMAGVIIIHKFA